TTTGGSTGTGGDSTGGTTGTGGSPPQCTDVTLRTPSLCDEETVVAAGTCPEVTGFEEIALPGYDGRSGDVGVYLNGGVSGTVAGAFDPAGGSYGLAAHFVAEDVSAWAGGVFVNIHWACYDAS